MRRFYRYEHRYPPPAPQGGGSFSPDLPIYLPQKKARLEGPGGREMGFLQGRPGNGRARETSLALRRPQSGSEMFLTVAQYF